MSHYDSDTVQVEPDAYDPQKLLAALEEAQDQLRRLVDRIAEERAVHLPTMAAVTVVPNLVAPEHSLDVTCRECRTPWPCRPAKWLAYVTWADDEELSQATRQAWAQAHYSKERSAVEAGDE